VYPLKIIQSQTSLTKRERRRAYRRERSACIRLPTFKCGPPAVEPQSIPSPSSFLTDYKSDVSDNFFPTSSKEGGVTDFNDSNSDYNSASDLPTIPVLFIYFNQHR